MGHTEALRESLPVARGFGFILNGSCMTLLTQVSTVYDLLAQVVATGVVLIWNFAGNRFWTFRLNNTGRPSR